MSCAPGTIVAHLVENYGNTFDIIRVENGVGIMGGKCPEHKASSAGLISSLENGKVWQ